MNVPGMAGPENVDNQSLTMMVSGDVKSTSFIRPKICGNLIYYCLESFLT